MSSGPGNIIIRIGAETAQALSGINNVEKSLGDTMTKGQKATMGLRKAALPAAAALGAIGFAALDATKAAIEDAAAQDKLAGQLDRVTGASDAQIASTEDWISKTSIAVGVADDELRPALGKLATATGDVGKAQEAMSLALDISAQTGKSLDTVTTALAKGYGGQTTAIGKLVPGMDKATLATKDMTAITAELADLTGGAAAQSAQTAEGSMRVWQIQMAEMKEEMGTALIPVVQQLMSLVTKLTGFMSEHTTTVKVAVVAIATLSAGILVANATLKAYSIYQAIFVTQTAGMTVAQRALNLAMSMNPIGLVIAALALLVVGIIIAYKNSETFRNIVTAAFNAVKSAVNALVGSFDSLLDSARSVWNWITAHWKVGLFAFGPIGAAIYLLITQFDKVRDAASGAFNAILSVIHAVESAINSVIGAVERLLGAISRIKIPKLPDLNPFMAPAPVSARGGTASPGVHATVGTGGTTVNVYGAIDPEGTARAIERVLRGHNRRQGRA